jgi:hypothetical protein
MHGMQKRASDSGHIFAWGAMIRTSFLGILAPLWKPASKVLDLLFFNNNDNYLLNVGAVHFVVAIDIVQPFVAFFRNLYHNYLANTKNNHTFAAEFILVSLNPFTMDKLEELLR